MKLYHPKNIDFYAELRKVQEQLKKKPSDSEIQNMFNWDSYPNQEFLPILKSLFEAYKVPVPNIIRLQSFFYTLTYDATVLTFFYKFLHEIPRPNQLDKNIKTYVCTHYYPAYPGGHATIVSAVVEWLSLVFPQERRQLDKIYSDSARGRFHSGVHFNADNVYGEKLGRSIGRYYYSLIKGQKDENGMLIDRFENPAHKPVLKVTENVADDILTCKSRIDRRAIDYLKKLKKKKNK